MMAFNAFKVLYLVIFMLFENWVALIAIFRSVNEWSHFAPPFFPHSRNLTGIEKRKCSFVTQSLDKSLSNPNEVERVHTGEVGVRFIDSKNLSWEWYGHFLEQLTHFKTYK